MPASSKSSVNQVSVLKFVSVFHDLLRAHFTCPICQYPVRKPVTLRCSHTYCIKCLSSWAKTQDNKGDFKSCPMCRSMVASDLLPDSYSDNEDDFESDVPSKGFNISLYRFLEHVYKLQKFSKAQKLMTDEEQLSNLLSSLALKLDFSTVLTLSELRWGHLNENFDLPFSFQKLCQLLHEAVRLADETNMEQVQQCRGFLSAAVRKIQKIIRRIFPRKVRNSCFCLGAHLMLNVFPLRRASFCKRPLSKFRWVNGTFAPVQCRITPLHPLLVFWTLFTAACVALMLLYGQCALKSVGMKTHIKKLIQHTFFLYFDSPASEMLTILYDAFTSPL